MLSSVIEMRLRRSVVLIRSDLPTITRRGADPWVGAWAGIVAVCVSDGTGVCWGADVSGCCIGRAKEGIAQTAAQSNIPSTDLRTFIFRYVSKTEKLMGRDKEPWKIELFHITWFRSPLLGI